MTEISGVVVSGSILDKIVREKREALEHRKRTGEENKFSAMTAEHDAQWGLLKAIGNPRGSMPPVGDVQIIAEIKKASPSKGVLAPNLDVPLITRSYVRGGAVGISVLTEENYFLGNLPRLLEVRRLIRTEFADTRPSVLRKDFIVDPYEVHESRAFGADSILLIAAILEESLLRDLLQVSAGVGLDCLVEVHDEPEAEKAVRAGATLFGINNRNLHTFDVDLATTERVRPFLPAAAVVVGESGVSGPADVERLQSAGVSAVLVGEAFMTAPDIEAKMAELRG